MGNYLALALISVLIAVYIYRESRHKAREDEIFNALASGAKAHTALSKRLDELEKEFNSENGGIDAETAEKMWKQGIDNLMNYSIEQAMGAISDGRN